MTKTSNVFKFSNFSKCFLKLTLYIEISMYRNLDFLVKSATVVGVFLVSVLMFLCFIILKVIAISGRKKKNQLLSCSIYCNLKLLFVHFWKKGVTIKKKIILCIFFNNTQKVITMSTACNSTKTWIFSQVFLKDFAYFLGTPI